MSVCLTGRGIRSSLTHSSTAVDSRNDEPLQLRHTQPTGFLLAALIGVPTIR
jgi:hypothetical protein